MRASSSARAELISAKVSNKMVFNGGVVLPPPANIDIQIRSPTIVWFSRGCAAAGTAAFAPILGNIQLPNLFVESCVGDSVVTGKNFKSVQHILQISVDGSVSNRSEKLRKFLSRGHLFE